MRRLFFALIALGLSLGTVQATTMVVTQSELEVLLEKAARAHEAARSYRDWSLSRYSPEHLAEYLLRNSRNPGFSTALCEALKNQPVENLYFLHEYFSQAPPSACLFDQARRYRNFLKSQSRQLKGPFTGHKLGPSEEIVIDNQATPLLIDGRLPDKTLVLTFDDGPHRSQTAELLDILAAENAQVQFFLVGQNSRRYAELIRMEDEAGHEVGCHADTHPDLRKLPFEKGKAEIENGFDAIESALRDPRVFFRFPYGAYTNPLRNYLAETYTTEFYWNIDTLDWKIKNPTELLDYALKQVRRERKGIVLMHDIQPQTIAMMPGFLNALKEEGYRLAIFRPAKNRALSRSGSL